MISLYRANPPPPSYSYCPPPPYTFTSSDGHPTFLLSYFLSAHLPPILSPPQMDTLPSQCELRLVRLQQDNAAF